MAMHDDDYDCAVRLMELLQLDGSGKTRLTERQKAQLHLQRRNCLYFDALGAAAELGLLWVYIRVSHRLQSTRGSRSSSVPDVRDLGP